MRGAVAVVPPHPARDAWSRVIAPLLKWQVQVRGNYRTIIAPNVPASREAAPGMRNFLQPIQADTKQ